MNKKVIVGPDIELLSSDGAMYDMEVDVCVDPLNPVSGPDYNNLRNKPSINGVTLQGNKTSEEIGVIGAPSNPSNGDVLVYSSDGWIAENILPPYSGSASENKFLKANYPSGELSWENVTDIFWIRATVSNDTVSFPDYISINALTNTISRQFGTLSRLPAIKLQINSVTYALPLTTYRPGDTTANSFIIFSGVDEDTIHSVRLFKRAGQNEYTIEYNSYMLTPAGIGAIPTPYDPSTGDVLTYDESSGGWIAQAPASIDNGLPAGGLFNQILKKNSDTDYDASWVDEKNEVVIYDFSADEFGNVTTSADAIEIWSNIDTFKKSQYANVSYDGEHLLLPLRDYAVGTLAFIGSINIGIVATMRATFVNNDWVWIFSIDKMTSGTFDYTELDNKPSINNVELDGPNSLSDLGIQPQDFLVTITYNSGNDSYSSDKTFAQIKIAWQVGKNVILEYGSDPTEFYHLSTKIDGPLEFAVFSYNQGTAINQIMIDETDLVLRTVGSAGTYSKPSGGIPATDLASDVIPTVPSASDTTPQPLGTAAAGSSTDYSRADHVHAKPTYSKSDVGLENVDNVQQYSASNPPPYPVTSVNGSTGAVTVPAVPSGGTTGQVLAKVSGTNYDMEWVDQSGATIFDFVYDENLAGGSFALFPTLDEVLAAGPDAIARLSFYGEDYETYLHVIDNEGYFVGLVDDETAFTIRPNGNTWIFINQTIGGGTTDYTDLSNKPQINSVTLSGNKSLSDLGIQQVWYTSAVYKTEDSFGQIWYKTRESRLGGGSDAPAIDDYLFGPSEGLPSTLVNHQIDALYKISAISNDSDPIIDLDLITTLHPQLIPSGGTTGQVLKKASGTNYDVEWGSGGTSDYSDLSNKPQINSHTLSGNQNASDLGLGTYSKPSGGIPKTDLESTVQTSLGKADTALQSYTETDPTVPSWAKASSKPSYTASEVGAVATSQGVAHAGEFVVVGSDGNITTIALSSWQGGTYGT